MDDLQQASLGLIIKNPERAPIGPRLAYVLRCAKDIVKTKGRDPEEVTAIIRGKDFYGSLGAEHAPDTRLTWANLTFPFPNSEHIHGVQLYCTETGLYIGAVSVFDVYKSAPYLFGNVDSETRSHLEKDIAKADSIVLAFTAGYGAEVQTAKSQLGLKDGWRGLFENYTKMVSIKGASLLAGDGDSSWRGKGVGRRVYHALKDMFEGTIFTDYFQGDNRAAENLKHRLTDALQTVVRRSQISIEEPIREFFDDVECITQFETQEVLGYSPTSPSRTQQILLEFLINPDSLHTFIAKGEGVAFDILKKNYDRRKELYKFDNGIKHAVHHDLTTDVVTFYGERYARNLLADINRSRPPVYFPNMDSFYEHGPADIAEKIAVLNIGLGDGGTDDYGRVDAVNSGAEIHSDNYVMGVGIARSTKTTPQEHLIYGRREGQVVYFIGVQEGVVE